MRNRKQTTNKQKEGLKMVKFIIFNLTTGETKRTTQLKEIVAEVETGNRLVVEQWTDKKLVDVKEYNK